MKKAAVISLSLIMTLGLLVSSQAATIHSISIDGLQTPSGIEAVNVWFKVGKPFSLVEDAVSLETAIPSSPEEGDGWAIDVKIINDGFFKFAVSNMDGWLSGFSNNLKNGTLALFSYDGSIVGVDFFQFGDANGREIQIALAAHDATSTRFAAVPIPAAAWLLGTGLIGLAALRRNRP